jgi:ADP-ribose pyrophosphatase YjhB (NUDIX family)
MDIRTFASVVIRNRDRILLVEEGREDNAGLLNLPGGHHDHGETLADCAVREALEETSLHVYLNELVGVYTAIVPSGVQAVRFVFNAHAVRGEPAPASDVRALHWMTAEEALALPEERVVSPGFFFRILRDVERGVAWPLAVLREEGR